MGITLTAADRVVICESTDLELCLHENTSLKNTSQNCFVGNEFLICDDYVTIDN